jgi:hypothetical protein
MEKLRIAITELSRRQWIAQLVLLGRAPAMKTPVAAQTLRITYHQAMGLIRYSRIKSPRKDTSGDYDWSASDLAAARKVLERDRQRSGVRR